MKTAEKSFNEWIMGRSTENYSSKKLFIAGFESAKVNELDTITVAMRYAARECEKHHLALLAKDKILTASQNPKKILKEITK